MLQAGIARTRITPYRGVELTGWGYYIERKWRRIHDHLNATALAATDGERRALVLALDLMVIDVRFTRAVRDMIGQATGLLPHEILLNCSHSHNAPAAGGLLGVGECDPFYEDWAAKQAATAGIMAWENLAPARFRTGHATVDGISFNRTRPSGLTDTRLSVLRVDRADGSPLAIVAGYGAHPTVSTEIRPWDVSRDLPGRVCDGLEAAFPGSTALYIQGACGDVNFLREYNDPARELEPSDRLVSEAIKAATEAVPGSEVVAAASRTAVLDTRRWTREELLADRTEAERRLREGDISRWRETIGRSMTNRPDDMVKRHGGDEKKAVDAMCRFHIEWTDKMLPDFETRPETLETEAQAIRLGDMYFSANSSEFFTPFALDIRSRAGVPDLMFAAYSNGRIGYLPDAHDIQAKSYAGYQSPKYCDQFPYTERSGPQMCDAMLDAIAACRAVG